jgi:NAD-dependent protein deacetylase/lipoamidase
MARPNATRLALAELESRNVLLGIITQNFDGLLEDVWNAPERVVELHGTSRVATCTFCGARSSIVELQRRISTGEIDLQCSSYSGYLKTATILFSQCVPDTELAHAREFALDYNLSLIVGSSLKVIPSPQPPRLALQPNVPLIIINLQPTSVDS